MANNKFFAFIKKHPILNTIIGLIVIDFILLIVGYLLLDPLTHHNEYTIVPDLKGMTTTEANQLLDKDGLLCAISDSVYDRTSKPGIILEQVPKAGAKIKDKRTVYIVISSFSTQKVKVPSVVDKSLRQAKNELQNAGISNIDVEYVPSNYLDLIIDLKMNGLSIRQGESIPIDARVTLVVGDGSEGDEIVDADSIIEIGADGTEVFNLEEEDSENANANPLDEEE